MSYCQRWDSGAEVVSTFRVPSNLSINIQGVPTTFQWSRRFSPTWIGLKYEAVEESWSEA